MWLDELLLSTDCGKTSGKGLFATVRPLVLQRILTFAGRFTSGFPQYEAGGPDMPENSRQIRAMPDQNVNFATTCWSCAAIRLSCCDACWVSPAP